MDQLLTRQNQSQNKTLRKASKKKLIRNLNQSVNKIAQKAYESEQCDKVQSFYSRNMLCIARNAPTIQPFTSRQNESQNHLNSKRQSVQKIPKKVRLLEDTIGQDMTYNNSAQTNFNSGRKQNDQLFITSMQKSYNSHDFSSAFEDFTSIPQTNRLSKSRGKLKTDRKWTFEDFLKNLYVQKTKDLKTKPNPKQQGLFLERFKEKFQRYAAQQMGVYFEHGKGNKNICAFRQINVSGSDFGSNAMKCICEFMLSNKIIKVSLNEIQSFCNVKCIILDKNPLGDEGVTILGESIGNFKVLQKLSMVSVNMSPKGAKEILKGLMGMQHLKHVNFSSEQGLNRNRIGDSTKQMELILSDSTCSWQSMNLSNTNIGEYGLNSISNGLTKGTTLEEIVLRDNDIIPEQICYFLSRVKVCNLVRLDLANNQIGDEGFKQIVDVIGCQYGHNSFSRSLKILNLSSNEIRSYSIEYYCKNMFNNNSLTELDLSSNNLSKGQLFFHFKFYISKNWTLKKLDLSSCFTDLEDLRHLFEGLEENRALLELKVSKNNFSVESFVAMSKMLTVNKSLKLLELESCNITDKFLEKGHKELTEVRKIEQINFNNNYLSDKSEKILLEMVNKAKSITKLTFLKNCLGVRTQRQISSILKSNRTKKQHSKIDEKQMEYLQYIAEIQQNNEQSIRSTIEKLREKEEKVKLSSLVCLVVKVELEEEAFKKELQEEMVRIKQLQQKLIKKTENYHGNHLGNHPHSHGNHRHCLGKPHSRQAEQKHHKS